MKVDMTFLEQFDIDFNGKAAAGKGSPSGEFAAVLKGLVSKNDQSVGEESAEIEAVLEKLKDLVDLEQIFVDVEGSKIEGEIFDGENNEAELLLKKMAEKVISALIQEHELNHSDITNTENLGTDLFAQADPENTSLFVKLVHGFLEERGDQLNTGLEESLGESLALEKVHFDAAGNENSLFLQQVAEKALVALSGTKADSASAVKNALENGNKVDWSLLAGDPKGEALLLKVAGKLKSGGEEALPPDLKAALKEMEFLGDKAKAALEVGGSSKEGSKNAFVEDTIEKFGLKVEGRDNPVPGKEAEDTVKTDPDIRRTLETAKLQAEAERVAKSGEQQAKALNSQKVQPVIGQEGIIQQFAVLGGDTLQTGKGLPAQLEALRENIMQQLEGRLTYFRETGSTPAEMRMTLHPPELGEVTIRVFSRQGQLSASILTESAVVKEILESSITELRQRLNFSNIQFEQIDVSTQSHQFNGSGRFGAGENNHENLAGGEHEGKSPPAGEQEVAESMVTADAANSGIDYWA